MKPAMLSSHLLLCGSRTAVSPAALRCLARPLPFPAQTTITFLRLGSRSGGHAEPRSHQEQSDYVRKTLKGVRRTRKRIELSYAAMPLSSSDLGLLGRGQARQVHRQEGDSHQGPLPNHLNAGHCLGVVLPARPQVSANKIGTAAAPIVIDSYSLRTINK